MVTPNVHEQCWEPITSLQDIRKCIQNGHHIMVIMRGIPGSGKSYLASHLVSGTNGAVFNTDKYFMKNGAYRFDPTKLDEYHHKNWREARNAILQGIKPIIIDNTNIFVAHMKPYINLALKNLYEIYFVEPETEWKKSPKECARRNAHCVPEEKIARMVECFEKVNLTDIIKPTQLRIIPPLIDINDKDDSYSLLPSKLDSSLSVFGSWSFSASECLEGTRKEHVEKRKVERGVSLSSAVSLCALNEEIKLLEISSSDSLLEKNSIGKKENSEQLFSLIPQQIPKKSLCTVGCQTSDLIRVLDLLDPLPSVSDDGFVWETIRDDVDFSNEKKMKGTAIQAGDGSILSDIELLLAFFPDEKPSDLSHILELVGFTNAVKLLKDMNARMNICASIVKNENLEVEPLSQTHYWWNEAEFQGVSDNDLPKCVPNFEMNKAIPEKLAPCTYMQRCNPEPVPKGHYRMELSTDIMEQLTQLFGGDENNSILKTHLDLPIWLWRQIYFYWQGTPTVKAENASGSEDFNFASVASSDEELARILQSHELASYESSESGKHMSIAERLQLGELIKNYPGVDRERIEECFRDNKFSVEATRNTLELFVNGTESIQKAPIDPSPIASPANRPDSCSKSAAFLRHVASDGLSVLKPDLESVHKEAYKLREEANRYNKQKHEMLLRARSHREVGAKMFYFAEVAGIELQAQKFGKKAQDCVTELNERLFEGNTSNLFIDLHYMNVQTAIKLLKAKLNAADRPPELRRGRSGKKLVVLTGYGKLNGQAKIKPAVVQWLKQCGYEYYNSSNKGELIVECK
uniref:Smr domain-containing protein n=1 Tax=Elaeophora elaphi TaxID=1147741 RepID=A0A158Q7T7_9BILA